jgi:outer membrane protein TolC
MNRMIFQKAVVALIAVVQMAVMTGCVKLAKEDRFQDIKVPQEKLRTIDAIDLDDMRTEEEPASGEPNEPAEEIELSLQDVRAITLENNLDLKVDLLAPAIAAEAARAEEAKFESSIYANTTYSKTDRPQATSVALVGSQVDFVNTNLGVEIPLRTGGTVTFDLADSYTKTDFTGRAFNPSYENDLTLSVSQPLLRNAGTWVNMHSIRIARYDRQIADATTKLNIIKVIAAADRAYWNLYAARRVLEVRKEQYELAQAQLERARRFVAAGQNPPVDVIRAEAGLAGQLATIIAAENTLRQQQRGLKRMLNKPDLPMASPTVIAPATDPDPVHFQLDAGKLTQSAIDNRMELLELELQIVRNLSTIDFMKNQALPLLTLNYNYIVHGLGESRGDSFDIMGEKNFEDHQVRLGLNVPLGNERAMSYLRQAIYTRRQQLATRQSRISLVREEVLNALDQLETSWQRILANRQSAILDGRLYEAEQRQYELNMRTSTEVLEAQTRHSDSKSAEYQALADYQISLVNLAEATGTLLGAAKIEWEPAVPDISPVSAAK